MSEKSTNVMTVDVTQEITKRRKGYKLNLIIGIVFIWFIPFGPFLLFNSIRWNKRSDKEMTDLIKKFYDKKAANKGKTVNYINIPK